MKNRKHKKSKEKVLQDVIKRVRKASREEEILRHGKTIYKHKITKSKKIYKRNKKVKLED